MGKGLYRKRLFFCNMFIRYYPEFFENQVKTQFLPKKQGIEISFLSTVFKLSISLQGADPLIRVFWLLTHKYAAFDPSGCLQGKLSIHPCFFQPRILLLKILRMF